MPAMSWNTHNGNNNPHNDTGSGWRTVTGNGFDRSRSRSLPFFTNNPGVGRDYWDASKKLSSPFVPFLTFSEQQQQQQQQQQQVTSPLVMMDILDLSSPASSSTSSSSSSMYFEDQYHQQPLRWHPNYSLTDARVHPSFSHQSSRNLETIVEDLPTPPYLQATHAQREASPASVRSEGRRRHTHSSLNLSNPSNDNHFVYSPERRHSDGDLLESANESRYSTRTQSPNQNSSRSSGKQDSSDAKGRDSGGQSRRRNSRGVDSIQSGEFSRETNDRMSGRSRFSAFTEDSLSSASKLAARHRSPGDGHSTRKTSSSSSLVKNQLDRKYTSKSGSEVTSERRSDPTKSPRSVKSASDSRLSSLSIEAGDITTLATLEIPLEMLETISSRLRKFFGPVIMFILVVTLMTCLGVAVYFAVVLKEFLQATLRFSLAKESQSRDFSQLTSAEKEELKQSYCKQVDELYKTSQLNTQYRGCELDLLTNERIEFKLYFLDSFVTSEQEGVILNVLASRAPAVGREGSELRRINDVTLAISDQSRSVDIVATTKPEDFYGANSQGSKAADTPDTSRTMDDQADQAAPTTTSAVKASSAANTTAATRIDNTVLNKDICISIHPATIVSHPTDCTHYIQCEFMKPIVRPCSGGLVFNPSNGACVVPSENLSCNVVEPCDNINGGHFAHPTNCKLFIICHQGKTAIQTCKTNLVWDNASKNCVPRKRGTECTPVQP